MDIRYAEETQLIEAFLNGKICLKLSSKNDYIKFKSLYGSMLRTYGFETKIEGLVLRKRSTKDHSLDIYFKDREIFVFIETEFLDGTKYIRSRKSAASDKAPEGYLVLNYEKKLFYIDIFLKEVKFTEEFLEYIKVSPLNDLYLFHKRDDIQSYDKEINYVLLLKEFIVFNKMKEQEKLEQEILEKKIIDIINKQIK